VVNGNQTYLRVARLDSAFVFHASDDGRTWNFVRYFTFDLTDDVAIGFSTQSPTGDACSATFDEIHYEARKIQDIRSGE